MSPQQPEEIISSREIFHGRIITLRVDTVRLPNGRTTTREIVEHPGAVVIVAANDRGEIAMVRQFRSAIRQETLDCPLERASRTEPLEACAQRELAEEMAIHAANWHHLLDFYSARGSAPNPFQSSSRQLSRLLRRCPRRMSRSAASGSTRPG